MSTPAEHNRAGARRAGSAGRGHRRRDIQGLRAMAVAAVIGSHVWNWPSGGFLGVDVFFVISGYLITRVLIRDPPQGIRASLADFYRRRARRILPLALVVLAAALVLAAIQDGPQLAAQARTDVAWAAVFVANWHFAAQGANYFDLGAAPSPVEHFWSLGVEEQFYLVWPLVVLALVAAGTQWRRGSPRALVAAVGLLVVIVSYLWALHQAGTDATTAYYSSLTRAWELGAGALLACLPAFRLRAAARTAMSWLGLVIIVVSYAVVGPQSSMPAPAATWAVLGSALVIAGGIGDRVRWQPALANPVASYLGDISYGLYLWHYPLLISLEVFMVPGSLRMRLATTATTVALAAICHALFEQPIIDWPRHRRSWSQWWVTHRIRMASAGTALVVLLAAVTITAQARPSAFAAPSHLSGALPNDAVAAPTTSPKPSPTPASRSPSAPSSWTPTPQPPLGATGLAIQRGLSDGIRLSSWRNVTPAPASPSSDPDQLPNGQACAATDVADPHSCTYGNSHGREIDIYGDSMGMNLLGAAVSGLGSTYKVRGLTKEACAVNGVDADYGKDAWAIPCVNHRNSVIRYVRKARPDVLVMVETYTWILKLKDGAQGAKAAAQWQGADQKFVDTIRPYVKHIVIVTPSISGVAPSQCYRPGGAPSACVVGIPTFWTLARDAEAKVHGVTFLDLTHWYCVDGSCPVVTTLDGRRTLIKTDYLHISATYERLLGPDLRHLLTAAGVLSKSKRPTPQSSASW
ncbi:acyltransferase family protein [Leekyejoonella antrihumi]|nr:acyltransferase family protein [Leekyejoonella antrihumi]